MANKLMGMLEDKIEVLEEKAGEAYERLLKEMKHYPAAEYIGEYSNEYIMILAQIELLEELKDEVEDMEEE